MMTQTSVPKGVVAAVSDLFFAAKISETAKQVGVAVEFANPPQALLERAEPAELVIIDLNAAGVDAVGLVGKLKAEGKFRQTRIIGFVRHEMTPLIEAAREAGCDQVLTRNAFSKDLPEILRTRGQAGP